MVIAMNWNKAVDVVVKFARVNLISFLSFLFGIIFVLCFIKTDKLSDSVSALANAIMAMAAIIGLVFARKWKRDATKDKVIDKCVHIMTVIIPDIKRLYVPTLHVKMAQTFLIKMKENQSTDFKHARELRNTLRSYNILMVQCSESLSLFKADLKYVKTLSWKVNEKINPDLTTYSNFLSTIASKQFELITYIIVIVNYWGLSMTDGDDSEADDNLTKNLSDDEFVDMCLKLCAEIIRLKEDLNKLILRINIETLSVFDVFEPS